MPLALRKPPKQQTSTAIPLPAPSGGMNAITPPSAVGQGETLLQVNMFPSEYGMRSRLGFKQLLGGTNAAVGACTTMPCPGVANRISVALWKADNDMGIFELIPSTGTLTKRISFTFNAAEVGVGSYVVLRNSADTWTVFAGRYEGYYLNRASDNVWFKVQSTGSITSSAWSGGTAYSSGAYVTNGGYAYLCTASGTSAGSGGPTSTGASITDGSCVWKWQPLLSTTADPRDFRHATLWKNRLWFVEDQTSRAWYLDLQSVTGTCTLFDFGTKLKSGSTMHSIWTWTRDGGDGIDDALVVLGSYGDLVMYEGTDPTIPGAFLHKGSWFVGNVNDAEQQIAVNYGGDLLIMTDKGIISTASLASGLAPQLAAAAVAMKVQPLILSRYSPASASVPSDGRQFAFRNDVDGYIGFKYDDSLVLALDMATRTWTMLRGFTINDPGIVDSKGYTFTAKTDPTNTRPYSICRQVRDTTTDNVSASGTGASGTPVDCSIVTGFSPGGQIKRVHGIRPMVTEVQAGPATTSYTCNSVSAVARYDGNIEEAAAPTYVAPTLVSSSGPTYRPTRSMIGATGTGYQFAIALRMSATYRLVLQGMDILVEQGRGVL